MGFAVALKTGGSDWVGDASGSGQVLLYDANGRAVVRQDKAAAQTNQSYMPMAGLDGGQIIRAQRVGEYGTTRTTSETLLFHDAFEGANINAWWTQSLTTMTAVQAAGVLTLNNSGITTLNTAAIITSARQFPKFPRNPLFKRFRANISAGPAANHTIVEMGFGAPSGVTAIISNGAFFRQAADGSLKAVISYNGTEQVTNALAQGVLNVANYYYYDIIVDDDFARFIVSDSAGVPVYDSQVAISLTVPFTWSVSHLPTFARVYVDATGGGTVVKLNLSAHDVQIIDGQFVKPWAEQLAGVGRSWSQLPTTQAQSAQLASSAPSTFTPTNGANSTIVKLGGEYIATMTAASENMLSLFAFPITSPYTFYIRGVYWVVPYVSTVFSIASTAPFILPFMIINASSNNISTASGMIGIPFGTMWTAAITAAVGTLMTGNAISWTPQTPQACLPGTFIHLGWKVLNGGAVTTGAVRGSILVDGYWE